MEGVLQGILTEYSYTWSWRCLGRFNSVIAVLAEVFSVRAGLMAVAVSRAGDLSLCGKRNLRENNFQVGRENQ